MLKFTHYELLTRQIIRNVPAVDRAQFVVFYVLNLVFCDLFYDSE
jgi:hypothetical protein